MPRREKRRHSLESTFDMRDPLYVLLLAVQIDESINPDWLEAPLRYYGNKDDYRRALAYLSKGANHRKQSPPTTPLTPVILSGLIADQQAREQEGAANNKKGADADTFAIDWIPAPELVSCCMTLRKNSLERIARRRKTRKLRIAAFLVAVGFVCGVAYHQTITSMERNMIELGYVASSNGDEDDEFSNGLLPCARMESDEDACRSAEAAVWAYFRDYSSSYSAKLRDCTRRKCSRDSRNIMRRQLSSIHSRASDIEHGQGPYVIHTIATREDIVLKNALSKSSFEPWWAPHEDDGRIKKGLQWLGDSTMNELVRKRLLEAIKTQKGTTKSGFRVLDVGCGIGGTLYALAGAAEDRWHDENEFSRIDYTGIAISSAEITNARRLAAEHEMDLERVRFQQLSFDSPMLREHGKFSAAFAIESLSFSTDISVTLSNLASILQSGGMLIVVDDVVAKKQLYEKDRSNYDEESATEAYTTLASRPSLLTHTEWKVAFDKAGFVITEAMDIGLHFALPQLVEDGSGQSRCSSFKSWLLRAARRFKQPSVFLSFLQKWEAWIRSRMGDLDMEPGPQVGNEKLAQLQAIQLMQQNIKFIRSKAFRKRGHEQLDLTYNMYVCTKR